MTIFFRANLAVFLIILGTACYIAADEPTEVEIGGSCSDIDAVYNLTGDIVKTPWQLNDLYALPPGIVSPEQWDQSSSFSTQFQAKLQSGETPAAFAQACAAVWQNFFPDQADVLVNVRRTISATHETLQCISGNWILMSTQSLEIDDTSDWLIAINSPFDVTNTSSTSLLESDLQNLLNNLNSQPGAASDPQ